MTKLTLTATNLQSERPPAGIQSDVVNGIIITAAIVLFVWTGGTAIPASVRQLTGRGEVGDQGLTANFLLNVALLFLAWRRYKDAKAERVRLAEEQDHARKLSLIDPLTGLGNRRALSELGDALIATARRRNKAVAMMLLDLDHFKNVNDVHGHSVGDALLRAVSAEMIRLSPESAICARLGGDEFACAILYDPNNAETVTNVASALIGRVAQPFDAAGIHTHI
ncbi:MAG: GGDEF domain-containing protein [Alphaproteobacteria bacterium]|nr:GGDEF domain-containing protein [Alphaproteobacteria bacterium]